MEDIVRRLKDTGVIPDIETTPRDNDLVAAMVHVTCNDPGVGEISVDSDPRFAHVSNSTLLDFASGIRTNFYLTTLIIQKVELGNMFLSELAESIKTNWTLHTVDLRHNSFTSDAIVEFCLAMGSNKGLVSVDLRDQHEAIHSQQEKAVLEALVNNSYLRSFFVEFRSEKCQKFIATVLERNAQKDKRLKDREKKITEFLRQEVEVAEKRSAERDKEIAQASKELTAEDCDYFYELANLAKKYKVDLGSDHDAKKSTASAFPNVIGRASSGKLTKRLDFPSTAMTADGSFLTPEYISGYFEEDSKEAKLVFEFTNQFKLFKRFSPDDPARQVIVDKFIEAIICHPRADDINVVNMANTCIADDFLSRFCDRCLAEKKLRNLHQLNLETNFLNGAGFVSLAKCIENPNVWRYLNAVKIDNQKSPIKTVAEVALARAFCVNRTVVHFSLRVRNLRERQRINNAIQRNIDLLRQARQLHMKKSGTQVTRARNKMEQLIDKIASNDSSVTGEVSIVGCQLFMSLNKTDVLKAASAFSGNLHVTSVKLSLLKLDDEFAIEFGKSMRKNSSIEKIVLDNNAIGGEGIKAIVSSLADNSTVTELQVRHQSKPMSTGDEELLCQLLGNNTTITKFGVDLRSPLARVEIERKIKHNQEKRRKDRSGAKPPSRTCSTDLIKSNIVALLFDKVIQNDPGVTEVILEKNEEFIQMPFIEKKKFLDGLGKNTFVTKLVLNNLELDNAFADELATMLSTNKSLRWLSADSNAFTSPGVLAIAKAATRKKRVQILSIMRPRFTITNEDAEVLVEAMEKKSGFLRLKLEFRDSSFDDRVAKVLKRVEKESRK